MSWEGVGGLVRKRGEMSIRQIHGSRRMDLTWTNQKNGMRLPLPSDMTTTIASVSNDDSSFEETEEWVAFTAGGVEKRNSIE